MNSEKAEELLDMASEITVHSGNIASWNKLRRRGALSPTAEVVLATEASFKSWIGRQSDGEITSHALIRNAGLCQKVDPSTRSDYSFTMKVFLSRWDGSLIRKALERTLEELGLTSVDIIILAFPHCPDDQLTLDNMKPVWQHMEEILRDGLAHVIGTADLYKTRMEALFDWAAVKPTVNQVNLAHCCTMPEDLVAFAKQNGITLFTHNDDKDFLPSSQLHDILSSSLGGDSTQWRHGWVSRYSSVLQSRGIISHKGYLIGLEKSLGEPSHQAR